MSINRNIAKISVKARLTMYKIDLHIHTKYSSACSVMTADILAEEYAKAGYSAITITDHLNRTTYKQLLNSPKGEVGFKQFIRGYENVKAEAEKRGLIVYRAAEIKFDADPNDYLVFNYPDSLFKDLNTVMEMGLEKFRPLAKEAGALIIQAHPFREICRPAMPSLLDGVEVANTHPRHENNNALAERFANENPSLIKIGGSDCHRPEDLARGGILSDTLPKNDEELAELLKSGKYTILTTNIDI